MIQGLKKADKKHDKCILDSYNSAAKLLGLAYPIKLGLMETGYYSSYVWYQEREKGLKRRPMFAIHGRKRFLIKTALFYQLSQIYPGDFFGYGETLYYYNEEDLAIYRMADFLDNISVITMIKTMELPFNRVSLIGIKSDNVKEVTYAWLLDSSLHPYTKLVPVFEDDNCTLQTINLQTDRIRIHFAPQGEMFMHGDELYQMNLGPRGITVEQVEINMQDLFNN